MSVKYSKDHEWVTVENGIAWVKFMGTHEQYDRINVESVNDY